MDCCLLLMLLRRQRPVQMRLLRLLLFLCVLPSAAEDAVMERCDPSRFGISSSLSALLTWLACSLNSWTRFPFVHRSSLIACLYRSCTAFSYALTLQVWVHRRLILVNSDIAELLAVLTLRETNLGIVHIHTLIIMWHIWCDFDALWRVIKKMRMFTVVVPSAVDWRIVYNCLRIITSMSRFAMPYETFSAETENEMFCITTFTGFLGFIIIIITNSI
jgi:hypothetical protein